jgi:hypothetical protein
MSNYHQIYQWLKNIPNERQIFQMAKNIPTVAIPSSSKNWDFGHEKTALILR